MEKEKFFMNEAFGSEIQSNELNPNCFFDLNWENTLDQSDPFESALSSMVSSPAASNAASAIPGSGDSIILRELIGRLGSICNSGDISPHSYIGGNKISNNNSTNTSCYTTPLNSPPKLNLSMMDQQIRENLLIPENQLLSSHPNLAPFSADPGFAERAARFSSFSNRNFGSLNGQFGQSESELYCKKMQRLESGKLSRVSSNQSLKIVSGSQMGFHENKDGSKEDRISASDKKFSRFSRSSTPENTETGDSREESSVSEQIPGGEIGLKGQNDANARKRKSVPRGKAKDVSSVPSASAKDAKVAAENEDELNAKRSKPDESNGKEKAEAIGNQKQNKDSPKPPEPPKDYIHVRARRGQATDSHSLAERVRREKISERMKFLQDLVPGCNKVTGKAVMLDEIINYVQSLQRQVEFLSMKLATVNPRMDFNPEALLSKEILKSRGTLAQNIYPSDPSAVPAFPFGFNLQAPSLQSGIPNGTETHFSMNAALWRNPGMPHVDGFGEAASEVSAFWEDDLQSVVQMGFGQNQPQNFHGSVASNQMKIEL